jgi:nucleoside-diphosphate-sugar epimerase
MRHFRLAYRTLCIQKRSFSYSHTFNSQKFDSKSGLLAGKRCIITGASRGIGAAIARCFAGEGGSCILVGRNSSLLDQVKQSLVEMDGAAGNGHQILVGDVGDAAFWERIKKEVSLSYSRNLALSRCPRFSKSVEAFDN